MLNGAIPHPESGPPGRPPPSALLQMPHRLDQPLELL